MGALSNHSLELTGVAGKPGSPVHRLDPRAKIVAFVAITVIAVSAPLELWPVYLVCALALAVLAVIARVGLGEIWRRGRWVLPLVLAVGIFVPLVRTGGTAHELGPLTVHEAGLAVFATVAIKSLYRGLLGGAADRDDLVPRRSQRAQAMRMPCVLVLISSLMYRYLYVIVEEVGRMRAALGARAYRPRNALQAGAIGRLASALFLRSYERGERVHLAMLARGYRRRMPRLVPLRLTPTDGAVVAALAGAAGRRPAAGRGAPVSCAVHSGGPALRLPQRPGERCAGVDLHIEHGERVALLGPNGAGKTTFVLHLNALLRGAGYLEVAGLEVGECKLGELRARVGMVFQDPDDQLFMPTVREDVGFGPLNLKLDRGEVETRIAESLRAVRMEHAAERAPYQLSAGERRRVAIATVLAMRPHLLVLDEPSANLDPSARRELLDVLERIERTMLITTHDLPLAAEFCERTVILAAGRVVADGPTGEILSRPGGAGDARSRAAGRVRSSVCGAAGPARGNGEEALLALGSD